MLSAWQALQFAISLAQQSSVSAPLRETCCVLWSGGTCACCCAAHDPSSVRKQATMPSASYITLLMLSAWLAMHFCYQLPLVQLDLLSDGGGYELSIPDDSQITYVYYATQLNDQCPATFDFLLQPHKGRWSSINQGVALKAGDKLDINLLVDHNAEVFRSSQVIRVGENKNIAMLALNKSVAAVTALESPNCRDTETVVSSMTKVCKEQLIFEENFDGKQLDGNKWSYTQKNLLVGTTSEEFVVFDMHEENIYFQDGLLNIRPTFTRENMAKASLDFGSRCTAVWGYAAECKILAMPPYVYAPPVNSSEIVTKGKFSFRYGRVEIRAKLPKGDWLFPHILLRNPPLEKKQIRIAFARGNEKLQTADGADLDGRHLYGGLVNEQASYATNFRSTENSEHYGNGFHVYTMIWRKDLISWAVDGSVYGEITDNLDDFREEFFLALGVSAGGHLEFPDNLKTGTLKPWGNTSPRSIYYFWQSLKDGSTQWSGSEVMQIDYVRIYAL